MAKVKVFPRCEARLRGGHPWVYKSDMHDAPEAAPGDVVDVLSPRGHLLGRGFYNPRSVIAIRLVTRADEPVDAALIAKRVAEAAVYRQTLGFGDVCRLIHAESDGLPGLIADRFGDIVVVQITSLGMERFKDAISGALGVIVPCVYERNDVRIRELEGLPSVKGFLRGTAAHPAVIHENGVALEVDYVNGQKTGYFLDQSENRMALRRLCAGRSVLDCFAHTGAFALNALKGGAKEAVCVELSEHACASIARNAALNEVAVGIENANVFDYLRAFDRQWDVIVLDPPAFAKNKASLPGALRGYKEINLTAMRRIKPGGFLMTCSCSHHVTPEAFREMVADAARDAGRTLRLVEERTQSSDHPILFGDAETRYLKCLIVQVM